jgi:hypothetical protein
MGEDGESTAMHATAIVELTVMGVEFARLGQSRWVADRSG